MQRTWRRALASGLLAALALGFTPATAQAQDKGPATFGVRPATALAPDDRPNFSYSATPGAVVKDHLAVANISNDPLSLKVYASDAFNTPDGGFDLLDAGRAPVDVGSWAKLDASTVEIPGRTTKIVPFTVSIPADATPGDHVGGIVAALVTEATGADGQRVAVEQRVGARIYLRISGDLVPKLTVSDVVGSYDGSFFGTGTTRISYIVRNSGNVRLGGKQQVTVETPWGSGTAVPNLPDLPELLPGNSFQVNTTVSGVLPAGWLNGLVHIDPVAPPGPQPRAGAVDASVTVAAVPWLLVVVLALVLALTLFLLWRKRKRRTIEPETEKAVAHAVA
ncbi:protein of unknown function [Actinokineospora alba]|uniref:DUF916 domain-containing protein n=1 Tax=Actinokineospora alba TaxID=504798 RepID=A0A1H0M4T9_9PSEU|nr:DUF916 domain-containing protein [Actinokineospora alba]TDP67585.1 uncharacterized protein DUF916 [Actinokineospora alba]SDI45001.1 protein of unknown function [Actinokineospora alba]SDO75397.1 protein of unknown function [Actinokineospora alba]